MIFVVDDDARIRSLTADALRSSGYDVREFSGGRDALAALEDVPALRLLVSDVLMPGMDGPAFVRALLSRRPDVRVQYISGDVGATTAEGLLPWPLLAKPFTAVALRQAVTAILG